MASRFFLIVLTTVILVVAFQPRASGQSSGWQTIGNPAGYQYQVPSDWIPGDVKGPSDTYMGSIVLPEAAYIELSQPAGSTAAARVQSLLATVLNPGDMQSSYTITNPSASVTVAGADAGVGAAATFTWLDGTPSQEYIIVSVLGTTGYALIVDLPVSVDVSNPALAQTILGSFQLGTLLPAPVAPPAAAPPPVATPASAPPPFRTPTPFPSTGTGSAAPAATAAAGSGGQAAPSGTTTAQATTTPVPPAPTAVVVVRAHTYYGSSTPNVTTIYCDTDPAWVTINPANLVSFTSLGAALTTIAGGVLHKPC